MAGKSAEKMTGKDEPARRAGGEGGEPRRKRPRMKWGLRRGPITGLRGILVTCGVGREQRCANEVSQLLDGVAAEMLGAEDAPGAPGAPMTLEAALAAERAEMGAGAGAERIQAMYSGVNGVIFVRVADERLSPTQLALRAAKSIAAPDSAAVVRETVRLIPLERTCQVNAADLTNTAKPLLARAFLGDGGHEPRSDGTKRPPTSYHVEFRSRNCSAISRDDGIHAVVQALPPQEDFARANTCLPVVDFKHSDVSIVVETFKSTCGVAVVPQYDEYKKFNLRALCDKKLLASTK